MLCKTLILASCSVLIATAPASAKRYRAAHQWWNTTQYGGTAYEPWGWGYPAEYYGTARQARRHTARRYSRASESWSYSAEYYGNASRQWSSSASGNSLVAEMRRHIGTNPTGWSHNWCGRYMDMALRRTGHKPGGNLARAYANYGTRVHGPVVGAIAVMARRGGGHVGVVSGVDHRGNPIVISGNHGHRVAESVYPRGRVYAYVMPD